MIRLGEEIHQPGSMVVVVPKVAGPADNRPPSVSQAKVVIQIDTPGGHGPFDQRPHEMHRNESAAELYHLRPAGGCLQPLPMVKLGIPIVDRSMIPAERNLEVIVLLEADNTALHFYV